MAADPKPAPSPSYDAVLAMPDADLLAEGLRAAGIERYSIANLIAVIAEIDARRLYLQEGCSSTFRYCMDVLLLSQDAAYDRLRAAKAAQKFPIILERLANGSLTLTNLRCLEPWLTPENYLDLLDQVVGKRTHEVKAIVARLRPELVAPQTYRLQINCSPDTWQKLHRVQELMRNTIPDGDPSRIFETAVALLLAHLEKRKFAKVKHPRTAPPAPSTNPRRYPAELKRQVAERDGYRCGFVGTRGRCTETERLEFHHRIPVAAGGQATLENLELRCRAHNVYEGELVFGKAAMRRRRARRSETKAVANDRGRRRLQPP